MSAQVSRWISVVGGTTLLTIGTLGGIGNIVVFRHRTLRSCPYALYMFIAAFFDLFTLDHALLLRVLADGFGLDPISLHTVYCCLRFYTGQIGSFVPITLICLAAVDRWASTCRSAHIRDWSSNRVARYSIILSILVWSILSIPNLIVYRVVNGVCRQTSLTYNDYVAFFLNPVLYGLVPVCVLASFGYATYRNIHQVTDHQTRNRTKVEEQLTKAIILQCASFIISQVPYTLWNLYLTLTHNEAKLTSRMDLETLFTQFTRFMFYFNYVSTFYINLIASKHLRKLARYYLCFLIGRRNAFDNRLHPMLSNTISRSVQHSVPTHFIPMNVVQ